MQKFYLIILLAILNISCCTKRENIGNEIFSVREISLAEAEKLYKTSADYNAKPIVATADSLSMAIIADAKRRFAEISHDFVVECDGEVDEDSISYDNFCWATLENLRYYSAIDIYCITVPCISNSPCFIYEGSSGTFLGQTLQTIAINRQGIIATQPTNDCDNFIELKFYNRVNESYWSTISYENLNFCTETAFDFEKNEECEYCPGGPDAFWASDNDLVIAVIDWQKAPDGSIAKPLIIHIVETH